MGTESRRRFGWGRVRRGAFFAWAAILSALFGITFIGVTVLTIGFGREGPHERDSLAPGEVASWQREPLTLPPRAR